MDNTITLDKEQIDAQVTELDRLIAAGEQAMAGLTADVAQLRGKRQVWQLLADALREQAIE